MKQQTTKQLQGIENASARPSNLFSASCDVDFRSPERQSWSFYALDPWTTCANLHHNRLSKYRVYLVSSRTNKWMHGRTDGALHDWEYNVSACKYGIGEDKKKLLNSALPLRLMQFSMRQNVPSQTFYSVNSRRIAHVSLAFTLVGLLQRYVAKSNSATKSEIPLT